MSTFNVQRNSELEAYAEGIEKSALVLKIDLQGTITYVNELFLKTAGYTLEEIIGENEKVLNSQYHTQSFYDKIWGHVRSGKVWRGEMNRKSKTGELYWVDATIVPSRDEQGQINQFIIFKYDINERKKMEQQLLEAQSISKMGSWKLNLLTGERTWSDESYKIYELDPEEVRFSGMGFLHRVHSEDKPLLEAAVDRAIKHGKDFTLNHKLSFDHGTRIKHIQLIARVTKDEEGKPLIVSGICRDRTADVENEQKYSSLLESMSEGVVILDSVANIIQHNHSAMKIVGLTSDELCGKKKIRSDWRAIRPDGTDFRFREHPAVIALMSGKPYYNVKMGIKVSSDETRWISLNAVPLEYPEGRRVLCTFTDITALVQVNEENKFVFDALGIGVWKRNLTGKNEIFWDNSMFRIYGIRPDEFDFTPESWMKLLTPESQEEVLRISKTISMGANEFNTTYELRSETESKKYVGTRGKVIRNERGEPVSIYGITWDQTKEVLLEKNFQLERAKALHNSKLASIGQLAAGVGHEINNPLSIISGHIKIAEQLLLNEGIDKNDLVDRFKKVNTAVTRIANIVKGLRTFARSDENLISRFDIYESLKESIDLLKEIYEKEGVELNLRGEKKLAFINGNRGRIQQVIVNLITNAKDATTGRDVRRIDVGIGYTQGMLKLTFTDNGSGIPERIREKIFEPFFTTKAAHQGTGIGLSLVSTIIKEHNGKLDLKTEIDKGTTFTITLPVDYSSEDFLYPEQNQKTKSQMECKVLIVDDEVDLRDILQFLFKKSCSKVLTTGDAKSALELIEKENFDLIVSDINMPEINGFTFLKKIRENIKITQPKFVFITGGVDFAEEQQMIVNKETSGILQKPFKENTVIDKLKELFPDKLI